MILTIIVSVVLAVVAVTKPKGMINQFSKVYGLAAGAVPDFWGGLLLIYFLVTTTIKQKERDNSMALPSA